MDVCKGFEPVLMLWSLFYFISNEYIFQITFLAMNIIDSYIYIYIYIYIAINVISFFLLLLPTPHPFPPTLCTVIAIFLLSNQSNKTLFFFVISCQFCVAVSGYSCQL